MVRSFALLIFSLGATLVQAQSPRLGSDRPIIESSIVNWTSDDGLASNNLTHVFQAKSGFLWISCFNGMTRFDGKRFEVFNRSAIPFLTSEAFYRIFEGPGGELWLASQGSGIVRYRDGEFTELLPADRKLPRAIRCLSINADGSIYAGSNNKGLYLIRDSVVTLMLHPSIQDVSINCLARDSRGTLWIGTNGKGLVSFIGDTFTQYTVKEGLSNNVVNAISIGTDGELIVGTSSGLNRIVNDRVKSVSYLQGIQVNDLQIDKDGILWAATVTGLGRIDFQKDQFEFLSRKQGLPSLEITGLNFDTEGSLWLTTSKAGLVRLKRSTIVTYSTTQGLSTNEVNTITEDGSGNFFIGSDGGDIDIMGKDKVESLTINTNLKNVGIRDILPEKDGTIWIGCYNGLLKKKGSFEKLYTSKDGLPAYDIRRILRDTRGNLWLGTRSGGIVKFTGEKTLAVYDRSNGLESNYVLCLEEDREGNIYAGTNGGGLTRISPHGIVSTVHISADDGGVLIFNIHINPDNSTWLVTNQGIFYFNGDGFIKLVFETKSVLGTPFDLCEDDHGGIWVSTNKGVVFFKRESARLFVAGEIPSIAVKQFDEQDGMKNRECTSATRMIRSEQGDIWIPTLYGLVKINPDKILHNDLTPPVYITHVVTDDRDTLLTNASTTEIPAGNLRVVFQFTALSYLAPERVEFKYQLEGIDKTWEDAETAREAQYTNLPPGTYTFRVIGSNNDGVWNETGTQATIVVLPFFYQTLPFYFLLALFLLLTLYLVYRWRLSLLETSNQELKKLNSELDKFVYSASHDLRAPLSSILGLVNVARQEEPQNKDLYLNLIEKSVYKLDRFINDIIDFSRNARMDLIREEIKFEPMIQAVMDDMKYMDDKNRILRTVKVIGSGPFYSDSRRLSIILNNLVSNAIKYHSSTVESPFIEVRVEQDAQKVTITVSDNGSGIGQEHLGNIFKMFYRATEASKGSGLGLYIVHETVEKLSGKVSVKSTPGVGSTFTVILPSQR